MDTFQLDLLVVFLFAIPLIGLMSVLRVRNGVLGALLMLLLPAFGYAVQSTTTPANLGPFVFYPIAATVAPGAFTVCLAAFAKLEPQRARWYPWALALGYVVTASVVEFDQIQWDSALNLARLGLTLVVPPISVWVGWVTYDALARRRPDNTPARKTFLLAVLATLLTSLTLWQLFELASGVSHMRVAGSLLASSVFGALFYAVPLSSFGVSSDHQPTSPDRLAAVVTFSAGSEFAPISRIAAAWRRMRQRASAPDVDPETGLLAESELRPRLRSALDDARRQTGELTMIAARADGLERVERDLGPDIAATVLDSAAESFMRATRSAESTVRHGDQFVAIFPNRRLERLESVPREVERFSFDHPDLDQSVTLQPTVARYPEDGTSPDELLSALANESAGA